MYLIFLKLIAARRESVCDTISTLAGIKCFIVPRMFARQWASKTKKSNLLHGNINRVQGKYFK